MVCIQIKLIIRTIRKNHKKDTTVNLRKLEIQTLELRVQFEGQITLNSRGFTVLTKLDNSSNEISAKRR